MYSADLAAVDFQHASEDARKEINQWVKGQTEGERLSSAGSVSLFPFWNSHLTKSACELKADFDSQCWRLGL
jgi:hypothetical protein